MVCFTIAKKKIKTLLASVSARLTGVKSVFVERAGQRLFIDTKMFQ